MARAALGSCWVLACAGVSLVQRVCQSLPSWGTRVSVLFLTHSDRDLPTRLFLPRSNFSCIIPLPSSLRESPSIAEQSAGYECRFGWGESKATLFISAVLTGMLTKTNKCKQISRGIGCYRLKKTESTGSIWPILGSLLGLLAFILLNIFFLKLCLHLSQKDCKYLSLFLTMCSIKSEAN